MPKLALALIGYLLLSAIIGLFTFAFLHSMCYALILKMEHTLYHGTELIIDDNLFSIIISICFVGAVIVFLAIFLFLVAQQFSYILEINHAIEQLEGGNLDYRVTVQGNNE